MVSGGQHDCNVQYMFHKGSERRETVCEFLPLQIFLELWNIKSSIFVHHIFLTLVTCRFAQTTGYYIIFENNVGLAGKHWLSVLVK